MYTLIARWTIKEDCAPQACTALRQLARAVRKNEPDTLLYLIHLPDPKGLSLPTQSPLVVTFFEVYRNKAAFLAHLNGKIFQAFVARHRDLFLTTTATGDDGKPVVSPFVLVDALRREAGYVRRAAATG
ncbi:MAG: antibiotic biosynthesis monooxygenase [Verrucomicrobia bacterium]|nr:antibiotic biosynthesis monooxygenase [Verrucomicrobiota bacterium]